MTQLTETGTGYNDGTQVNQSTKSKATVRYNSFKEYKPKLAYPKTQRTRSAISKRAIESMFGYSQRETAEKLGVSISTLKRRFSDLYGAKARWPYNRKDMRRNRMRIDFIMNEQNTVSTKYLDPETIAALEQVFRIASQ